MHDTKNANTVAAYGTLEKEIVETNCLLDQINEVQANILRRINLIDGSDNHDRKDANKIPSEPEPPNDCVINRLILINMRMKGTLDRALGADDRLAKMAIL